MRAAGPAPRVLRLDGLRGRAGLSPTLHMEGRAGQLSGVQFQSPDLLGPTRPALQLLLAVPQRLRIDLGLLRERRWGEERREKGAVRSGAGSRPARPPQGCSRARSSERLCQPEDKEGLRRSPPRARPLQHGEKRPPSLRIAPGRAPGRGEGQSGGGSSPGPAG